MKQIISWMLALFLAFSLSLTCFADNMYIPADNNMSVSSDSSDNPTRAEETMWVTRWTDDGLIQKRLWSITYGYWLTDWITVGYWDP